MAKEPKHLNQLGVNVRAACYELLYWYRDGVQFKRGGSNDCPICRAATPPAGEYHANTCKELCPYYVIEGYGCSENAIRAGISLRLFSLCDVRDHPSDHPKWCMTRISQLTHWIARLESDEHCPTVYKQQEASDAKSK